MRLSISITILSLLFIRLTRPRAHAIDYLYKLENSYFIVFFGDPITNPKDWKIEKLESICNDNRTITYGVVQPGQDVEKGVPMVRPMDLNGYYVTLKKLKKIDKKIEKSYERTRLVGGEILLSIRGTVGPVGIASPQLQNANVSRGIAVIEPNSELKAEYLLCLFKNLRYQELLISKSKGIALKQINLRDLRQIDIMVPPISEQMKFVHFF